MNFKLLVQSSYPNKYTSITSFSTYEEAEFAAAVIEERASNYSVLRLYKPVKQPRPPTKVKPVKRRSKS